MDGFTARAYFGICGLVQALEDRLLRPYPDLGAEEQGRRLGTTAVRGRGARIFFGAGALSEVSDASHSLRLHSIAHAPWQPLGSMRARAFCGAKFEVGSPRRELLAVFCH